MALLREVHPGEVGVTDRIKPSQRHPPITVLFEKGVKSREGVPVPGVAALLGEGDRFFFGNFQAPTPDELEQLRREFGLHPLAIEDVETRHQRVKIDIYGDHYFLVFYRIGGAAEKGEALLQEVDFFIGRNFLIVTHDGELPLLDEHFGRFCRTPGGEKRLGAPLRAPRRPGGRVLPVPGRRGGALGGDRGDRVSRLRSGAAREGPGTEA